MFLQMLDRSAVNGVCKCTWSVLNDRKESDSGWMRYYPDSHNICPPPTYNWSTHFKSRHFFSSRMRGIGKGTYSDGPIQRSTQSLDTTDCITSGSFPERPRKVPAYQEEPISRLRVWTHTSQVPSHNYTPISRFTASAGQQNAISAKIQGRYNVCRGILEN
jgi:hypothetical protein